MVPSDTRSILSQAHRARTHTHTQRLLFTVVSAPHGFLLFCNEFVENVLPLLQPLVKRIVVTVLSVREIVPDIILI
jgi:hypothetical protein